MIKNLVFLDVFLTSAPMCNRLEYDEHSPIHMHDMVVTLDVECNNIHGVSFRNKLFHGSDSA